MSFNSMLKKWWSRLPASLSNAPDTHGTEACDEMFVGIAGAREASVPEDGPDEGPRPASIFAALASRCDVGRELLELNDQEHPGEDACLGTPSTAVDRPDVGQQATRDVVVPCVPGSIPARGLQTLNSWALAAASADAEGVPADAWLPRFLVGHASSLTAAVRAADFLGCKPFLELMLEVQLLRVALLRDEDLDLELPLRPLSSWRLPALSELREADFRALPCIRQTSSQQHDAGGVNLPPVPQAYRAGPAIPQPPQRQHRNHQQQQQRRQQQRPQQRHPAGELAPHRLRLVNPQQLEALVGVLVDSELIGYLSARAEDVRTGLYRLGFLPAVVVRREEQMTVSNKKLPYLRLPLTGAVVATGGHYQVEAVTVGSESHDQGWSSYPENRNTYDNSWTWAELVLQAPASREAPSDSIAGAAAASQRRAEAAPPERLYTNLHAVSRWQPRVTVLGPQSSLVRQLNEVCFLGPAVGAHARTGAGAGADGKVSANGGRSATPPEQQQQQPPQPPQAPLERPQGAGCELVLLVCAEFPGWAHHIRRAEVMIHLRPAGGVVEGVGAPPYTAGEPAAVAVAAAAGGSGGEGDGGDARRRPVWEARHRQLVYDGGEADSDDDV